MKELNSFVLLVVYAAWQPGSAGAAVASDGLPGSGGVRGAFSATYADSRFVQVEAFAGWDWPFKWESESHWYCDTSLDASAGVLMKDDDTGFVGTVGPLLKVGRRGRPVYLDLGLSPTILSRSQFGSRDFGSAIEFTSHVGLAVRLGKRLEVGYRFQHMSNAGLSRQNPGLNLHSFGLRFSF